MESDINIRIWAIGDIHGSYFPIRNFYNRNKDNINFSKETDCIILLGDVGANYYFGHGDKKFKEKLEEFPFTYFCIRGNHEERPSICAAENPDQWSMEEFFDGSVWIENNYPDIKYAMDTPYIYNIPYKIESTWYNPPQERADGGKIIAEMNIYNYRTLVIPGAYSVDKYYRLANKWSWFEHEQLSEEEMDLGRKIIEQDPAFDLVLSHTCPISYEPTDLFLSQVDQSIVDKTMERYLSEIEYKIDYKLWLWGHFHEYRIYPKYENKQCIMLSNGKEVINIKEWLTDSTYIHTTY